MKWCAMHGNRSWRRRLRSSCFQDLSVPETPPSVSLLGCCLCCHMHNGHTHRESPREPSTQDPGVSRRKSRRKHCSAEVHASPHLPCAPHAPLGRLCAWWCMSHILLPLGSTEQCSAQAKANWTVHSWVSCLFRQNPRAQVTCV